MDRLSRKQNVNQQAKLKIYYACVLSELQKANLKQELASISQWIKENKNRMNPPIFLNVAYSLAMIYYNNLNDFTQSKKLFEVILRQEPVKINSCGIYYFTCCDMLGEEPLSEILNKIDRQNADVFLMYFVHKYSDEYSEKELIRTLTKIILPELKKEKKETKIHVFKTQWKIMLDKHKTTRYREYYEFICALESDD